MCSGPGRRHEDPDSGRTMPAAHGEIPPPFKSAAARSSRWTAWGRRRQRCGPIAARADRKAARVSSSAFLQAGDAIPPAQYTGTHQPPAHLRTPLLPIQPAAQSSMSRPALRPAIADTKSRCCELPPSSLSPTCRVESSVQRLSKFVRSIAATRRGTRAPLRRRNASQAAAASISEARRTDGRALPCLRCPQRDSVHAVNLPDAGTPCYDGRGDHLSPRPRPRK